MRKEQDVKIFEIINSVADVLSDYKCIFEGATLNQ